MPSRQRGQTPPRVPQPVFEHVVTAACDSFLWRQDDYPCERNGWNIHPEVEST